MKTETYCTSAGCRQWRALHAESADGLLSSDVCNNAAWPGGAEWPMQPGCTLWCVQGDAAVLHMSRHRALCSQCCMPPTAGCSLCCSLQFLEINIVNGSDDWDWELGRASSAGAGLLPRVKRNRAEVTRKSGETHSRNCVLGKLCIQSCGAAVLPLQDPKRVDVK